MSSPSGRCWQTELDRWWKCQLVRQVEVSVNRQEMCFGKLEKYIFEGNFVFDFEEYNRSEIQIQFVNQHCQKSRQVEACVLKQELRLLLLSVFERAINNSPVSVQSSLTTPVPRSVVAKQR